MSGAPSKPEVGLTHTLMMEPREEPGATMSESQYERVQDRIKKEIRTGHGSSIWLAFAFAAFGIGSTILITVKSMGSLGAETRGQLEVAGWASLAVIALCVFAHFMMRSRKKAIGDDICDEMDTACGRRKKIVPPNQAG